MQFSESWLRQYCNPSLNTQQLADTLTMAGLEVEEQRPVAPAFSGVVVARILDAVQHPNADRLRVCTVDAGQGAPLSIVCGAPNARAGILVPCALVGAELPSQDGAPPFKIKLGKLRGVESQGMLCSAKELSISDESGGLLELAADAKVGISIREHLDLDDTIFTLKLTPNLAHCLSVYGIARELAALTRSPLKLLAYPTVGATSGRTVPVNVTATDLCGRFSGRVIQGIDPSKPTPTWMVQRLERCGQRSVNALVDISNYVMFELGRPTHIFDLDKLNGGIHVRWANDGERLKLLNGNTVDLQPDVGVIADDLGVESLAGIMGGESTAVSHSTTNIYVEAAFWWPSAVAGRSRRYNFSTDAGHRFERGVDPALTVEHIEYITQLVLDICGGSAGPITDVAPNMPSAKQVELRVARAQKVLGMQVTQDQCETALCGLGLSVVSENGVLRVSPPSYRFDIQIEEDLIEEVARVVGYDNLPDIPPVAPIQGRIRPEAHRSLHEVRKLLATLGYQETINFSFIDEVWERSVHGNSSPIRVLNPISSQMNVMRSSLIASLLSVAKFNIDRKVERLCAFEVGRVFKRSDAVKGSDTEVEGVFQPQYVSGLVYGPSLSLSWEGKASSFDFFDVKGHVEQLFGRGHLVFEAVQHPSLHPGRAAAVLSKGKVIGVIGEVHPRWRQEWGFSGAPVVFELMLDSVLGTDVPSYRPFSKFPTVERDISVWVKESTNFSEIQEAMSALDTKGVLRSFTLFDIYKPPSEASTREKSFAMRLVFQRDDGSLTDDAVEQVVGEVLLTLGERIGARLRT